MWLKLWGLGFGSWIAVVSVLVRRIDMLVRVVDFILDGDGDGVGGYYILLLLLLLLLLGFENVDLRLR